MIYRIYIKARPQVASIVPKATTFSRKNLNLTFALFDLHKTEGTHGLCEGLHSSLRHIKYKSALLNKKTHEGEPDKVSLNGRNINTHQH